MLKRLMKRGETSGRVDDKEECIKKHYGVLRRCICALPLY